MKVLPSEKIIGINTFFSSFPGVGGKLRYKPEDFTVKEISNDPKQKEKGRFGIAEVTAVYWETNNLVREFSNQLHISRKRINFAGTKDKRAKTTRLMSFHNVSSNKLKEINIKDVKIENIYESDHPVKIGNLVGNNFSIIVRNIKKNVDIIEVEQVGKFIENIGGFPNFFGIQRFGVVRPNTHIVGKHLVNGDLEKAVMSYVANPIEGEDEEVFLLRKNLQENYDFAEALKTYPDVLNFEKAILNKLVVDPKDYVAALKELPANLLTMFIYAYQSYLFNKILSERIIKKMPINEAIIGDIIHPVRNGIIEDKNIFVTTQNIDKVNKQANRGKAVVSGVLFGSDSVFSKGEMGEIEERIVDSEKIDPRDFIIPDLPFISSSGLRRSLRAPVNNLKIGLIADEYNLNTNALKLDFDLKKGCYATSLLREFMKADAIRNY